MSTSTRRKYLTVAGAGLLILGSAAAAVAYWTNSGAGAGSATVGSSTAFTVTVAAPTGGALSPNGPTDTVSFTVTNAGSGSQRVTSADVVAVAKSDGTTWTAVPGCSAADFSITNVTLAATTLAPTGQAGNSVAGSFKLQMIDTGADQAACQGVAVPLYVHVH